MVSAFGFREVVAITDRELTGAIDATILADALTRATVEIDSFLDGRYPLPLPRTPPLLTILCCDIARYRLCGADAQETDPARNRYRDACKTLERIKAGHQSLGLDSAQVEVPTAANVRIVNGRRTFGRRTLEDY
jgi:phage gp36-like protein